MKKLAVTLCILLVLVCLLLLGANWLLGKALNTAFGALAAISEKSDYSLSLASHQGVRISGLSSVVVRDLEVSLIHETHTPVIGFVAPKIRATVEDFKSGAGRAAAEDMRLTIIDDDRGVSIRGELTVELAG